MSQTDLLSTLDRLSHPHVLVLGDLILDRYTWGNAERVSQEAPVMLLRAQRREQRLGGAANVCQMLRGLEASVECAGVLGDDADGQVVRQLLSDCEVGQAMLLSDARRITTVKQRFIGKAAHRHPHQILRVDDEVRDPLHVHLEAHLIESITEQIGKFDIVLISDYGKGVCTPKLLQGVIKAAKLQDIPVLVDPLKGSDYTRYRGATALTPNRVEAETVIDCTITDEKSAFAAGVALCNGLDMEMVFVTLDHDGMALVHTDGRSKLFPTRPRNVYDITGAGDMVLAMIGLSLAAGVSPENATQLGNVAGGLEVEQVGVAVISRSQIRQELLNQRRPGAGKLVTLDQMEQIALAMREQGRRIVFTNGCYDLLHVGHVTNLSEAALMGDSLVVGINSDASVRKLKGPQRPVIPEHDRAAMLAALECVDFVLVFNQETPHELLHRIQPHVLVKGGTYRRDEVVGHEVVEAYGGEVRVTGVVGGISTTNILSSLAQSQAKSQGESAGKIADLEKTAREAA